MSKVVCGGAVCKCSCGTVPSMLNVTGENKCMASAPIATIADNIATKNIKPFGMCTSMMNPAVAAATSAALGVLTPQSCMPMIASMWMPGSSKLFVGGKPALTADSTLTCIYGGTITIKDAGQDKVHA